MGNIISSFISGFTKIIGNLFGSPLDFLSGKSCSSLCVSTWDFICYIENFCFANLLKMAAVLVLLYIVLLFFYLLHKLGICECIGHSLCKMTWACLVAWFSMWECCCVVICDKLVMLKRRRQDHHRSGFSLSEFDTSDEDYDYVPRTMEISRSVSHRMRNYKGVHLRKSLRPRSHRVRVGVGGRKPIKHGNHVSTVHNVRVTHTSKFVRKGSSFQRSVYPRRRW